MTTREENLELALKMIDWLAIEIKCHECDGEFCIRPEVRLNEKRLANHKRSLINKIRLSVFDIEDGIKTLDEVLKS